MANAQVRLRPSDDSSPAGQAGTAGAEPTDDTPQARWLAALHQAGLATPDALNIPVNQGAATAAAQYKAARALVFLSPVDAATAASLQDKGWQVLDFSEPEHWSKRFAEHPSSPAAAVKALTTRLEGTQSEEDLLTDERLHDGAADDLSASDLEPPAQVQDASRLQELITTAKRLSGQSGDPKLAALIQHVGQLLKDGYHPVVFCRYIATAHYVAHHLKTKFPQATIEAITGEFTPEERRERVEDMGEADSRILVATDCLSEGINLQHLFTAVVHYDLAWNPTRHEQREGRVDRFGQQAPEVRCTMLYGQDNPIDGFVLKVILRKGEAIQKELGVMVPLPEDDARINQALVKAALMRREHRAPAIMLQESFDFGEPERLLAPLQAQWQDALEKAKANRTVFAQRRIRPDEVLPEWHKQQQALGAQADVKRFLQSACVRLGSPLDNTRRANQVRFTPQHLPEALRLRLADEGLDAAQLIDFDELHRSHPLVGLLAQHLLEDALGNTQPVAARCAATLTNDVEVATTLYLLRVRHQLSYVRRREPFQMMAEETVALAVRGRANPEWLADDQAARLIECTPSGNLPPEAVQREVRHALEFLAAHPQQLQALAQQRAHALLDDHKRVREAARDVGQYNVKPCLPVDVMGVYATGRMCGTSVERRGLLESPRECEQGQVIPRAGRADEDRRWGSRCRPLTSGDGSAGGDEAVDSA